MYKSLDGGKAMSGDAGLDEPIIFYHKKMTKAKVVLLSLKGIELQYEAKGRRQKRVVDER